MRAISRLTFLLVIITASMAWSGATAQAQPTKLPQADRDPCNKAGPDGKPLLLRPGDEGYRHTCLHPYYKQLYDSGKCHCHTGFCRPTKVRHVGSRTEILISGHWYTFPREALRRKSEVPPELWELEANVCAHPTGKILPDGRPEQNIECVMIPAGT